MIRQAGNPWTFRGGVGTVADRPDSTGQAAHSSSLAPATAHTSPIRPDAVGASEPIARLHRRTRRDGRGGRIGGKSAARTETRGANTGAPRPRGGRMGAAPTSIASRPSPRARTASPSKTSTTRRASSTSSPPPSATSTTTTSASPPAPAAPPADSPKSSTRTAYNLPTPTTAASRPAKHGPAPSTVLSPGPTTTTSA